MCLSNCQNKIEKNVCLFFLFGLSDIVDDPIAVPLCGSERESVEVLFSALKKPRVLKSRTFSFRLSDGQPFSVNFASSVPTVNSGALRAPWDLLDDA